MAIEAVTIRQIPTEIKTSKAGSRTTPPRSRRPLATSPPRKRQRSAFYDNATCTGSVVVLSSERVRLRWQPLSGGEHDQHRPTSHDLRPVTPIRRDSTNGQYSWKIVYTPAAADTSHTVKQSACDAEHFTHQLHERQGPARTCPRDRSRISGSRRTQRSRRSRGLSRLRRVASLGDREFDRVLRVDREAHRVEVLDRAVPRIPSPSSGDRPCSRRPARPIDSRPR